MTRTGWLCWVLVVGLGPAASARAQVLVDPTDPRFRHAVAARRAEVFDEARQAASLRLLEVAGGILFSAEAGGRRWIGSLPEAQRLADSLAFLEGAVAEATASVTEARRRLIEDLEGQVATLRRSVESADAEERRGLEARIRGLESEVGALREGEGDARGIDALRSGTATLVAFSRVVEAELTRARTVAALEEEARLYLGSLRLFDETGMPPSARAQSGGDTDPGCPVSACPTDALLPADVPLEHVSPDAGEGTERGEGSTVGVASLSRLQEWLRTLTAGEPGRPPADPTPLGRPVRREATVALGVMDFRGEGGAGSQGVGVKAGAAWVLSRSLGEGGQLTVEPWLGARSLHVGSVSSHELVGEVRETVTGSAGGGGAGWSVTLWQKGRFLSEPLSQPAFLHPGRWEGGAAGRLAFALRGHWALEVGSGGDLVRYDPEGWRVLDHEGVEAVVALRRRGDAGAVGVSLAGSRHDFPFGGDLRRKDTRVALGADWWAEGSVVFGVSAGLSWNDSLLPAFDYRSGRGAVVLSAPWGSGSVQGYGALAHQSYRHPGGEGARVAPSDQNSGAVVALQYTRHLGSSRSLAFRADWSRSQTGFRDAFYQRFGSGLQVSFRGLGAS